MKKLLIIFSLFCITIHAQEKEEDWQVFNGFDIYYTSFFNTGNTMTRDAHRNYAGGLGFNFSLIEYRDIGLELFYNHTRNSIHDITMIADFDFTKYNDYGLVFSYQIPLTEKTLLKPKIGYNKTEAKNSGEKRKAYYKGNGLLIGAEYLFFVSHKIAFVGGVHYNYQRFNLDANTAYKNYFSDMHRIQFKIGIHFKK